MRYTVSLSTFRQTDEDQFETEFSKFVSDELLMLTENELPRSFFISPNVGNGNKFVAVKRDLDAKGNVKSITHIQEYGSATVILFNDIVK